MKVYKVLEDYFCVHSKESLYLKKGDIIILEKCTSIVNWKNEDYKEVNILTKLIRDSKSKTINIVEPKLSQYGIRATDSSYIDFENISKEGIKEQISGTINGYFESKPIVDITVQYFRNKKLQELL